MDRKRRRELALAGAAVLLIAIAAWSMQRGTASPSGAAVPDGARAPEHCAAHRRARSPRSISTRSKWNVQSRTTAPETPSGSSQSLRRRCRPPRSSKQQQAAAAAQAASRALRAATAAAHSAEVHRRHVGSETRWKENCDSERCTRHVLRPRRGRGRRAISDREDRRRINRACISRRTRAPDHQTNRTINRE